MNHSAARSPPNVSPELSSRIVPTPRELQQWRKAASFSPIVRQLRASKISAAHIALSTDGRNLHQYAGQKYIIEPGGSGLWQGECEGDQPSPAHGVSSSRAAIRESQSYRGSVGGLIIIDAALAVFEPEAVAVHLEDVNVVGKAIEQAGPVGSATPAIMTEEMLNSRGSESLRHGY